MIVEKIGTKLKVIDGSRRYVIPFGYSFENNFVSLWSLDDTTIRFKAPLSDITDKDGGTFATIDAFETYIVPALGFNTATGGSVASIGMMPLKTGQTTSYRTGDDGDNEAGIDVDFFTLPENNPFGNTNRFTDLMGGQLYEDGVKLDWFTFNGSTVLGIETALSSDLNWNKSIDYSNSLVLAGFSGWRAPNFREVESLYYHSTDTVNQWYKHMNWVSNAFVWTSNTSTIDGVGGIRVYLGERFLSDGYANKLSEATFRNYSVRNFTLAELGL